MVAATQSLVGDFERGRALAAIADDVAVIDSEPIVAFACNRVEAFNVSRRLLRRHIAAARTIGAISALAYSLTASGEAEWWLGDWNRSYADLHEAVTLSAATDQPIMSGYAHGILSRLAAARGDRALTDQSAAAAANLAATYGIEPLKLYPPHAFFRVVHARVRPPRNSTRPP